MAEAPSPPFPNPDSAILDLVIKNAYSAYERGEADVREAIVHAAIYAWYEGHIEGEDGCPGCTYRGRLSRLVS
jgi:hypothetical protein